MSDVVIRAENLGKRYLLGRSSGQTLSGYQRTFRDAVSEATQRLFRRNGAAGKGEEFWALQGVNFEVGQGEVIGIIGHNGAGKSTLLKILSRITEPTAGKIRIIGRVASLLEVGTGFHPELTGRENIFLNGAILGMSQAEIKAKFDEIVAFAEVERFLDTPVKRYSSGMYVRLAFAVAAHLEPEILVIDEVLAVGDAEFQKKCLGKMQDVHRSGRTVLFVSHNMQAVRQLCSRVLLLRAGQIAFKGKASEAIHAYFAGGAADDTIDLSRAQRRVSTDRARLTSIAFRDERGESALSYTRDGVVCITFAFTLHEPVAAFELAMALTHANGTAVFSETLSDERGARPALAPGDYELPFRFRAEYLKQEPYVLTVYLFDGAEPIEAIDGIPIPEIEDPEGDSFKETQRLGVVRLPVEWGELTCR